MLRLQDRLRIASNQSPRNHVYHVHKKNEKFDPNNKLYQFVNNNITRLSIGRILKGLDIIGFLIYRFH